jgi:hypothetical protein
MINRLARTFHRILFLMAVAGIFFLVLPLLGSRSGWLHLVTVGLVWGRYHGSASCSSHEFVLGLLDISPAGKPCRSQTR